MRDEAFEIGFGLKWVRQGERKAHARKGGGRRLWEGHSSGVVQPRGHGLLCTPATEALLPSRQAWLSDFTER